MDVICNQTKTTCTFITVCAYVYHCTYVFIYACTYVHTYIVLYKFRSSLILNLSLAMPKDHYYA